MSQRGSDTEESDESQRPALFTDYGKRTHQAATCDNYRPDASSGTGLSSIESSDEEDKPSCDMTERMTTTTHRSAASRLAKIQTSSTMSRREDTDEESDENDRPTNFTDYGKRTHQSAIGNNYRSDDYVEDDMRSSTHTNMDDNNQEGDGGNARAADTEIMLSEDNTHRSSPAVSESGSSNARGQPKYMKDVTCKKIGWKVFLVLPTVVSIASDYWAIISSFIYIPDRDDILILEIVFLILSCIISFIFSERWYYIGRKSKLSWKKDPNCKTCKYRQESRQCIVACVIRHIASLIFLSHLPRKIDAIRYRKLNKKAGTRCSCKINYYNKAKELEDDSKILGMFDLVIEGVPTFIIQVAIVLLEGHAHRVQIVSMTSSAIMMPISIALFNMASISYDNISTKAKILCRIVHTMWKFFELVPRIIAFAAFAVAVGGCYLGLGVALNTAVLLIWVLGCQTRREEDEAKVDDDSKFGKLYLAILTVASNFFSVNTQLTGDTRKSKLIYYIVVETQNILMVVAWILTKGMDDWWTLPIIISVIGSIVPKVTCMLIFYFCCHPHHKKIRKSLEKGNQFPCCCRKSDESSAESATEMDHLKTEQGTENMDETNNP